MLERERVAITGSEGTIGKVLTTRLNGKYDIFPMDLPDFDLRKPYDLEDPDEKLMPIFAFSKAVVHLAWDTATENKDGGHDPENGRMTHNVLRASVDSPFTPPRVIIASSIHVDNPDMIDEGLITTERNRAPQSMYGNIKGALEIMARVVAEQRVLEVVVIRFGGINPEDKPPEDPVKRARWLSHADAASLVEHAIDAPRIPGNFTIVHGVSDNPGRVHDLSNPLGWQPMKQT